MTGEEIVDALAKLGNQTLQLLSGRRIVTATAGEAATEAAQEAAIVGSTAAMGGEYKARNSLTVPSKVQSSAAQSVAAQGPQPKQ